MSAPESLQSGAWPIYSAPYSFRTRVQVRGLDSGRPKGQPVDINETDPKPPSADFGRHVKLINKAPRTQRHKGRQGTNG